MDSTLGDDSGTTNDPTTQPSVMQPTHLLHTRPPTSLGTLGKVPPELRSQIYDEVFSPHCYLMTTDPEACSARLNNLNILMTSQAVRSEALDDLASKTFTIGCYIPHKGKRLVINEKVDIPNVIQRNVIKRLRHIQVILDAPYLCGYVDRDSYWRKTKIAPTVLDWPSIAKNDGAPATDLLLALPNILARTAEDRHGVNATIVLQGSYNEFRYPVTEQGEKAFKDLVAVFKNFDTLKLRAEATVRVRYGSFGSSHYKYLKEKRKAQVARAFTKYMNVLIKKARDVVGPSKWTEDKADDGDELKSGIAEFHPLAYLAAAPLPNQKTKRNNRRKKLKRKLREEHNGAICQQILGASYSD